MHARFFQRFTAFDRFADTVRVLIALSGVMCYTGLAGDPHQLIPLMLGVIASGIAETDDSWRRRARALGLTLICFSLAALIVQLLLGHPWAFAPALGIGTFLLVMLGAASARFATISKATLLLAVYTMIGVAQHTGPPRAFWVEPALLVLGAAWYGLLALAWQALFVHRPVRQSLARLYIALADYLVCKSWLFEPVRDPDVAARRADLAHASAKVVAAMDDTRAALIDRLSGRRSQSAMRDNLALYLAAQDVHERASSAHHPYEALSRAFFHSDLMFRCQRLLRVIGQACRARASALRYEVAFDDGGHMEIARQDLDEAIAHRRRLSGAPGGEVLHALEGVAANLGALVACVAGAGDPGAANQAIAATPLADPQPNSVVEMWRRIQAALTPASARFRHALRLSLAMLAGYGLVLAIHPDQGYWILLTTMLVCQPDTGATRQRFLQRVGGTVVGLVCGWALLTLFPGAAAERLLIVAAGVAFFTARFRRYFIAAAAISVLVLLAFDQVGNGFDLIVPRLIDTVIGGGLAALAMLLVLPDWRERDLQHRLADALFADAKYLRAIFAQYQAGERVDDLAYRIVRRAAHNADASVSAHVASALSDVHGARADSRESLTVLACAQTLIGHLSTLGAHRQALPAGEAVAVLADGVSHVADALEHVAEALIREDAAAVDTRGAADIYDRLTPMATDTDSDPGVRRVAGQLVLLMDELPTLRRISAALVA